jgi:hypothetical protein
MDVRLAFEGLASRLFLRLVASGVVGCPSFGFCRA